LKTRINLFLLISFTVTLAVIFSTGMFLAQMRAKALQWTVAEQDQAIRTFWQLLLAKGSNFRVVNGRMMAGSYVLNGNYELPDTITSIFGGTATIFMGDTRISTNVLKKDGSRAVGTRLTGPVYDAIFRDNRSYRGEAMILGVPYYTAYDPIRDPSGKTIGVLYAGIKKTEFLAEYAHLRNRIIFGTALLEIVLVCFAWGMLRGRVKEELRLQEAARVLSETTGDSYFISLVKNLSCLLETEFAFIGELTGEDLDTVRVLAAFGHGKLVEPFSYHLDGTPCAEVIKGSLCHYPDSVARRYPNNRLLNDMNAEGFLGIPLKLADGRVVGILAVLDSKPLHTRHDTEPIFRLFAVRAAAELDRLRSEKTWRVVADRIRVITDSVSVAIAYVDMTMRYLFANRRYEELFGVTGTGQLVGRLVHEVVGDEFYTTRAENIRKTLAGNKVIFIQPMTCKDGTPLVLQTTYSPHLSDEGKVVGYFIQHYDITQLTLAQEALRSSEEQYRTLFNTTGTATFVSEEDTTVSLVNEEFVTLSGYSREEVEGRLSWTVFVSPECSQQMISYHQSRRIDPTAAPHTYECETIRRDGSHRNMLAHVNLIPGSSRSIISFLDITELKQLDAGLQNQLTFLQTLIDTIPNPIFYKDRGGRYTGCNLAFGTYLGRAREELVGKTVYELAPTDLADRYHEMDEALFADPGVQVYDASVVYADGSRHDVTFNKATFVGKNGCVEGLVGVILDITERKKAEDLLAEREEFLSNIFDSIQDGISILDEELRIVRVNPVIARRFPGKDPLLGRKCHEAFHGRTEPCESCPTIETLRSGKPSFKKFALNVGETLYWLELYTFPLYDSKKSRIMGVIEYSRDVTEQHRVEEALILAEKKFRGLVEQSLVGTYIIQDSRFVYVNPKMAEIFGYTPEELTAGVTHLDLMVEEDRLLAAKNVRKRSAGEVQIHYGFRGLRKDETTMYAEVYGTGTQYNGRPAIIGTLLDVTDRMRAEASLRESEERFHQIFVQNGDAIVLFRMDGLDLVDANPAALELFGYDRAGMLSMKLHMLISRDDFDALVTAVTVGNTAETFQLDRAQGIRSTGELIIIAIRCKILRLREEYVVHCSFRDITEKVRLEEEIRSTQAKLIHTNKMTSIGMLASSVAHEINNPNNCISVNADMLADIWHDAMPFLEDVREEQGDFMLRGIPFSKMRDITPRLLNGITEGSRRITAIVHNMRDYVREDRSGLHGAVDINRLIQNAASILWHHIHIHTDKFQLALEENLPMARGNSQQIEQVVINLITNALQALPDKKSGVTVATAGDRSAGTVTITVRDEGKGMDGDILARLKEPFFTTKLGDGGTGLGLYISDSILTEHRGTLEFDSCPGSGTTATVMLAMADDHAGADHVAPRQSTEILESMHNGHHPAKELS
jgi:PAS domain S-box-containing protein